jgi:hypothetical protein
MRLLPPFCLNSWVDGKSQAVRKGQLCPAQNRRKGIPRVAPIIQNVCFDKNCNFKSVCCLFRAQMPLSGSTLLGFPAESAFAGAILECSRRRCCS